MKRMYFMSSRIILVYIQDQCEIQYMTDCMIQFITMLSSFIFSSYDENLNETRMKNVQKKIVRFIMYFLFRQEKIKDTFITYVKAIHLDSLFILFILINHSKNYFQIHNFDLEFYNLWFSLTCWRRYQNLNVWNVGVFFQLFFFHFNDNDDNNS